MERIMTAFTSYRIAHEYTQTNPAPPEKIFPLLCPVREADWVPGWQYQLIYSASGAAELGCIFTTPNSEGEPESTWITTVYDPVGFRVGFVWINPGRVASEILIQLTAAGQSETRARVRYRYTGLSPEGNREVERYDEQWFKEKMQGWESAINHYLLTGTIIASPGWE
jgi:hypothetical protein